MYRLSETTPACAVAGRLSKPSSRDTNRRAMKVLYFPIKARNVLAQLVAKKGGLTCALETPAWVRGARCDEIDGALVRECEDDGD